MKALILLFWLICLPCFAIPPLAANAGPDQTNSFFVPVVLDGTTSTGNISNYYWSQISGPPVEIIGQDRRIAMLLPTNTLGVATFRLQIDDTITTNTDDVAITVTNLTSGRVIYADNLLDANTTTYSIANRNNAGTDGNGYPTIQAAVTALAAGDQLYIRGGNYVDTVTTGALQGLCKITANGTPLLPVRISNYNGENVGLVGFGFSDADTNSDGLADGQFNSAKREELIYVQGNYVQITGLDVSNSQNDGILIASNFCYVADCRIHDNWLTGINPTAATTNSLIQGIVLRRILCYRQRHQSGIDFILDALSPGQMRACAVMECVSFKNGYQPNGSKVLPINGDSQGGGDSDGIVVSKQFHASAVGGTNDNLMTDCFLCKNICYSNCDDGFDTSFADSMHENNRSLFNGPTGNKGYKMFSTTQGMTYRGCLAFGNGDAGFEMRPQTSEQLVLINDSAISNGSGGLTVSADVNNFSWLVRNMVGAYNVGTDLGNIRTNESFNNWAKDGVDVPVLFSGAPNLVNPIPTATLNFNFDTNWSNFVIWQWLENQFVQAFAPTKGSGLIDAGIVIKGYHCPRADDDPISPMTPNAPGRHWYGLAPDIGAFEFSPAPNPTIILNGIVRFQGNIKFGR